jgi:hypothetical protein
MRVEQKISEGGGGKTCRCGIHCRQAGHPRPLSLPLEECDRVDLSDLLPLITLWVAASTNIVGGYLDSAHSKIVQASNTKCRAQNSWNAKV